LQLGEVLLTGGNGYLGARIAKELQSRSVPVRMLHYSDVQANLSIPIDIGQAETLLLVGAAIPKNSVDLESISAAASNVAFMETLIRQEFKQLRRIIYISTIDVYDYQGKIDESTIPNPQNLYGLSKLMCERIAIAKSREMGISCTILRMGNVYGGLGDKTQKVINVFSESIKAKLPLRIVGSGLEKRHFLHVIDAVDNILHALNFDYQDLILNVIGASNCTITELAEKMISISGKEIPIEHIASSKKPSSHEFNLSFSSTYLLPEKISFEVGLEELLL
jgi:UDP-glucose 4-epimerase